MATVEYAALVVLVSVAAAAGGAAVARGEVATAVGDGLRRALCLVQSGDCLHPDGPQPCVVRSDTRAQDRRASVAVVRLADGRSVVREVRSDGTVAVTEVLSDEAGGAVVLGVRGTLHGRGVEANGEVGARGRIGYGRRFVVADGAAADRLIGRLGDDAPAVGGAVTGITRFLLDRDDPADERFAELGGRAEAIGVLQALGLEAGATALAGAAGGVRVERRTGRRAVLLRLHRELAATLGAPLGLAGVGGGRADEVVVETAFDRSGRATSLTVAGSGSIRGDASIHGLDAGGGDRVEAEARLDLADPVARELLEDLVERAGSADPQALGAARALGARIADRARIDVRTYATDRTEQVSGGRLGFVAEVGYEEVTALESARLVAAHGREPGLDWARRLDCVASA